MAAAHMSQVVQVGLVLLAEAVDGDGGGAGAHTRARARAARPRRAMEAHLPPAGPPGLLGLRGRRRGACARHGPPHHNHFALGRGSLAARGLLLHSLLLLLLLLLRLGGGV